MQPMYAALPAEGEDELFYPGLGRRAISLDTQLTVMSDVGQTHIFA